MFIGMAIIFGLLSMLGYGLYNATSQPLAKRIGTEQSLFLRGLVMMAILAIGALTAYGDFSRYKDIFITIGLGIAGYLPVLAFTHGIKISRISIVGPIGSSSPLITVLLSFLVLGVHIHFLQWLAIILVVCANIAMTVDLRNWRNSSAMQLSSGIPFAFMAAVGWGAFYFFLVYSTHWLGPWLSAFLVETGVTIAAGAHVLLSGKKVHTKELLSKPLVINATFSCVGTVAYAYGVLHYNVGIVAALSNSTAIVAAIVATYIFHEHLTKKEKIAVSAMVAGIVAITLL